jgi:Arc/MetJ-type ribon-helix-helix transcriptional regulator
MGVVQHLPDHLRSIIERQVAEGRVASGEQFLEDAVRQHAEDLEAEDEIVSIAEAGIADIEAGRYATISTPEDGEALHQRMMGRLHARLTTRGR